MECGEERSDKTGVLRYGLNLDDRACRRTGLLWGRNFVVKSSVVHLVDKGTGESDGLFVWVRSEQRVDLHEGGEETGL